jgi:MoxR-like ATPase
MENNINNLEEADNLDFNKEEQKEEIKNEFSNDNSLELYRISDAIDKIKAEIQKVVIGQDTTIDLLLAAIFANGHVLMEGVPGIAKTLIAYFL